MSSSWQERYASKLKTARAALSIIRRGFNVFIGSGAAEPRLLVKALAALAEQWGDRDAVHTYSFGCSLYPDVAAQGGFRHHIFAIGPNEVAPLSERHLSYLPVPWWRIADLFRSGYLPLDVALIQVTPPDERGFCSLGPSVDIAKPAVENARHVIAEVNPRLPWTWGDSLVHIDQINALVEVNAPLPELRYPSSGETARRLAQNVAGLIEDGVTLQISVGSIPQALLAALVEKQDLGLHTAVLTDGMMDLIKAGVVTNRRKSLHPDKTVVSACWGTARLYDFIRDNPSIEFHPLHYTSDPCLLARNEYITAVNVASAVDLIGQACLAPIAQPFQEGLGMQADFARGVAQARGGKSIIVLPSTREDLSSRIVSRLPEGAISLSYQDVHYVVTEYGVMDLRGRDLEERAVGLISIAHPRFRQQLLAEAEKLSYMPSGHPLPAGVYPGELETVATFKGGLLVHFRPIRPTDERLYREFFYSLSERTIYARFFSNLKSLPQEMIQRLTNIDYEREMVIVGLIKEGSRDRLIACGQYAIDPESRMAEVALLVQDDYQRRGIGFWLLNYLGKIAWDRGAAGLRADILAENYRALSLVRKGGYAVETSTKEGCCTVSYRFPRDDQEQQ